MDYPQPRGRVASAKWDAAGQSPNNLRPNSSRKPRVEGPIAILEVARHCRVRVRHEARAIRQFCQCLAVSWSSVVVVVVLVLPLPRLEHRTRRHPIDATQRLSRPIGIEVDEPCHEHEQFHRARRRGRVSCRRLGMIPTARQSASDATNHVAIEPTRRRSFRNHLLVVVVAVVLVVLVVVAIWCVVLDCDRPIWPFARRVDCWSFAIVPIPVASATILVAIPSRGVSPPRLLDSWLATLGVEPGHELDAPEPCATGHEYRLDTRLFAWQRRSSRPWIQLGVGSFHQ